MKKLLLFILILFIPLCFQQLALAGGPLVVKGGMAITYDKRPFLYRYDKGPLGMFSNSEAIALIEELYHDWDAITTTELKFQRDDPGSLSFDVTASDYESILKSDDLLGYTAVVFDNDGTLLDSFLGDGAGSNVLGLSGPITVSSGPLVNQIAESQAVFNGRFVNGIDTAKDPETTVDAFKGTIIHETGHGLGLDHSQINVEAIKSGATQELRDSVPLEFPVAVNDLFIIRRDDASSISLLYPNESALTMFGKIEGKIFRKDGQTPVLGANVIARNTDNPKLEAISCVSDFLKGGDGHYTLFAVPPGKYRIEIEPIDLSFTGASGVGPYAESKTSESFQNPVPKGYYTGSNQPITQDINNALVIEIQAGQTIKDANIIANTVAAPNSSSSGGTNIIEEVEPNNSPDETQKVLLPATILGMASVSDDGELQLTSDTGSKLTISDLFQFTLNTPANISALLTIDSDLQESDLDLALFNASATMILDSSSQTGNADELISKSLSAGTYLLGVGAFSGSTSYTLRISADQEEVSPTLEIIGQDTLILKSRGGNKVVLKANAFNFPQLTKCRVTTSNDSLVKVKPKQFLLSKVQTKKKITVRVPLAKAFELIENDSEETATITIVCENGTSDEFDLLLTPTLDNIVSKVNKNKWYLNKTRKQ